MMSLNLIWNWKIIFRIVLLLTIVYKIIAIHTTKVTLVVTRKTLSGYTKSQITINGTVPGPTINVTIGNWVEVCSFHLLLLLLLILLLSSS